jgi:hypothetical protein
MIANLHHSVAVVEQVINFSKIFYITIPKPTIIDKEFPCIPHDRRFRVEDFNLAGHLEATHNLKNAPPIIRWSAYRGQL